MYLTVLSSSSPKICIVWEIFLYIYPQNKKQRKMVREAVLKSKDPRKILEEIEKIENMGK